MTFMTKLRKIVAFLSGKTVTHRACDITRAEAARIMNIGVYS